MSAHPVYEDEPEGEPKNTPYKLTVACFKECGMDEDKTRVLVEERLLEPEFKELAIEFLRRGIAGFTRLVMTDIRKKTWIANDRVQSAERANPSTRGIVRMAETVANDLLDYPLIGFGALGDANKEDVESAITKYTTQIKGTIRTIKWLKLIVNKMGNAARVRDVLTHEQLFKLQIQADKE